MKINKNICVMVLTAALAFGGAIAAQAQQMRNSSGSNMGRIESNGRVYNSSGSYMGRIESNGRIYNSSGSFIGEARGGSTKKAAVLFFFKLI